MTSVPSAAELIHLGMDTSVSEIAVAVLRPGEEQLTQLPGISRQARHIGHRPRSCSTSATGSSAPAPHAAPTR